MTKQNEPTMPLESLFMGLFFIGAIIAYFFMDAQTAILLALLALVVKPTSVTVVAPPPPPLAKPEMTSRKMGE